MLTREESIQFLRAGYSISHLDSIFKAQIFCEVFATQHYDCFHRGGDFLYKPKDFFDNVCAWHAAERAYERARYDLLRRPLRRPSESARKCAKSTQLKKRS